MRSAAAVASPAMNQYCRPLGAAARPQLRRVERGHQRRLARRVRRRHATRRSRRRSASARSRSSMLPLYSFIFNFPDYIQPGTGHPGKRPPLAAHFRRQDLASPVEPRPDRADRASGRRRGVLVTSAPADRTGRPPRDTPPADSPSARRSASTCCDRATGVGRIRDHARLGARRRHRLVAPRREPPPRVVPGDAQQPRDDRRAPRHVAGGLVDHRQEDVLRDVFRRRRRARHVQREPINIRPPPADRAPRRPRGPPRPRPRSVPHPTGSSRLALTGDIRPAGEKVPGLAVWCQFPTPNSDSRINAKSGALGVLGVLGVGDWD